jgi:uncharacterized protein (TIGR01244 family)
MVNPLARVVLLALAPALATPALLAAGGRWIHDASGRPPRLEVEQAIWAMTGLPRGGKPWTREEQVERIAAAGFDGFMVFLPAKLEDQDAWRELAAQHGLAITLQCAPSELPDLEAALAGVARMRARGLVAMIRPTFVTYEEGARKIREMTARAREAGVPFYVETHRGTITQDLLLTGRWAETVPDVQFHADLSHFVISYEVGGAAHGEVKRVFDAVLARAGMLDGRVGNGEQVQIDIGPRGESPHAQLFAGWWKQAMVHWLRGANPGDIFVFKSELGPPSYSIVDLEEKEVSDRWVQALVMRDLGIRTWNEAVKEAGRGEPYVLRAAAASAASAETAPATTAPSSVPAGLLDPKVTDLFPTRGACHRLGDDFYLSGQLPQPDLDLAKEKGVKTVVNVRLKGELGGIGFDVAAHVQGIGLKYVHFPIAPESLTDEVARKFIETIDESEKPLLVLDSNGNRAWGLWALYLGARYGVPVDETQRVAQAAGIEKLVIDGFVRGYLERRRQGKAP